MYVILDKGLNRIGQLSLDKSPGSCPFWGDEIDIQIADDDSDLTIDNPGAENVSEFNANGPHANTKNWNHTLNSINVPYGYPETDMITQGNHLAYYDESSDHWYVMRMTDIVNNVDASGTHYKSVTGVNLAIWNLGHKIVPAATIPHATVKEVFEAMLGDTGWTIGTLDLHGGNPQYSFEFDGSSNAQSMLQTACQTFDIEVDAYVEFGQNGDVIRKRIDVVDVLGEDDGKFLRYGDNITGITRTISDANLFTRLIPKGQNGETIESVNGGKNYVQDDEANDLYNSHLDNEGATYLEGVITSNTIANKSALLDWAKRQLKVFNHVRANYTVTGYFNAGLGDYVRVQDLEMVPELTVMSRVIQKKISQADPTQNQCIIGEFTTVKTPVPSIITDLQNRIDSQIKDLIDQVRNGTKQANIDLITPQGSDWTSTDLSKTVIARVFVDGTNLTSYFSKAAFSWYKTDSKTGVHDVDWENKHAADGYEVILDPEDVGTLTCSIDGDYLKSTAELSISTTNNSVWQVRRVDLNADWQGNVPKGAFQFVWHDTVNDQYVVSMDHGNGDTEYLRYDQNSKLIDALIATGGGHGSSFGCRLVDGSPEIWTSFKDTNGNSYLGTIAWQSNKVVTPKKVCILPKVGNYVFRRINCDFANGYVMATMTNGLIEVCKLTDIKEGNWLPVYSFKVQQFGIKPSTGSATAENNTLQSNSISFPYIFLNSGDVNNADKRLALCVNCITESQVFLEENIDKNFAANSDGNDFEPETIGVYRDSDGMYLLQGFTYLVQEDSGERLYRGLWKTNLIARDDSGDLIIYKDEDKDSEEVSV